MKRPHYAGEDHVVPVQGSPGYIRVVNRGCGGREDYWGEFSCDHGYTWRCDDCPIVTEQQKDRQ